MSSPLKLIVGPEVVPFACVVEDDVEDHLDVVLVQLADEHLELVDLLAELAVVAVVRLGGEERDGVVAPGVGQSLAGERVAERAVELVELHDRQELDGRDPQFLQVGDLLDEAAIGPGQVALRGVVPREAADVHLVDDRLLDRDVRVPVPFPVEVAPVGDATGCSRDVVDRAGAEVAVGVVGIGVVVPERIARLPVKVARDGRRVGVDQRLGRVEPRPVTAGFIRAVGPDVVQGPVRAAPRRRCARYRPSCSVWRERNHLAGTLVGDVVEQKQLDPRRPDRLEREVDPVGIHSRPQGFRQTGQQVRDRRHGSSATVIGVDLSVDIRNARKCKTCARRMLHRIEGRNSARKPGSTAIDNCRQSRRLTLDLPHFSESGRREQRSLNWSRTRVGEFAIYKRGSQVGPYRSIGLDPVITQGAKPP